MSTETKVLTPQEQLDADVAEWRAIKTWLVKGKAQEIALRQRIAAAMFGSLKLPNGCFPEGTSGITVEGSAYKYEGKLNAKLNREVLEEIMIPTLTEAQLTAEEGKGLIRGKPELGLTAYRKLPPAKQAIIDKMLVVKPGSIELDIEVLPK